MSTARFLPLDTYRPRTEDEMLARAREYRDDLRRRRTVRDFSDRPVPRSIIEACIEAAGTAPNGANRQPWHFVAVGNKDQELRRRLRDAAEEEEQRFYTERAPPEWLEALNSLGTDEHKPFLEQAPWLIAIFAESYELGPDGKKLKNYYVTESVGIATGLLISAVHEAGLVSLTHTPSPMGFLNQVLERPDNERPFLLLVVGYPASDAQVPAITKKPLTEISTFLAD